MYHAPNPQLNETAAGLVSDSLWVLLERHGVLGLPLAQWSRDPDDSIRIDLSSGHVVYVDFSPQGREVPYRAKHRR